MIRKLAELGISGKELQIFESFLTNREQFVEINNVRSSNRIIQTGVPQGSKLAATLFLIYINNALKLNLKGTPQFYADDGSFMYAENSFEELISSITCDLKVIEQWFNKNFLKINLEKTNFIIFKNYKPLPDMDEFPGIIYNNVRIRRVEKLKYLGIWFDTSLNWSEHINSLKLKLIPFNFALYRNRNIIPQKQLWLLYNAYFMSQINYLNPIWSRCADYKISELQRLQNKVIKNILSLPIRTSTASLYEHRLNIKKNCILQTLLVVFKIKNNMIKNNLDLNVISSSAYSLRNITNIRSTFFRTGKSANSIRNYGVKLFNKLPGNVKTCTNTDTFKKYVTMLLLQNYNFDII